MKVHIGSPSYFFGPYQLAEKLLFWIPKQKDEYGILANSDTVHNFGEFLAYGFQKRKEPKVGEIYDLFDNRRKPTLLYRFMLWIQKVLPQRRIKVRIDSWDSWNMYTSLGYIVRPMLYQLKESKQGAPHVDDEDVPKSIRSTSAAPKENEYDIDENHFKRWDYILDEMIFAFESLYGGENQYWETQFTTGEYDFKMKKLESGHSEILKGPNHTVEVDLEGRKQYSDRIQNGFMLFGKYYTSLWS